jgi:hypothetical protein
MARKKKEEESPAVKWMRVDRDGEVRELSIDEINEDNYYTPEMDKVLMSVSLYKSFVGFPGRRGCEFTTMKKLAGEWTEEPSTAMLVWSYVDSYVDGKGALDKFKQEHPEIFKRDGTLKADFITAEKVIERIERDKLFMAYLSGEKQRIMLGNIGGVQWKIKMDSYSPGRCITDLKVMRDMRNQYSPKHGSKLDFIRYWGYDIQGAVYQEVVYQNTGERLPFFIAAATKESPEPNIELIEITSEYLALALDEVREKLPHVLDVKYGRVSPTRCGECDCCKHHKELSSPITITDLLGRE